MLKEKPTNKYGD